MRIGIIETGYPPRDLGTAVPSYPEMIRSVLGPAYEYCEFDVARGDFPDYASAIDAYLITGSASGVHDGDQWIDRLRDWLVRVDSDTPLVGICFGHQVMAEAYGGLVDGSKQGWAIGLHEYKVRAREAWMDDVSSFVLPTFHRDQVIRAPPASRNIAAGDLCPYAALSYIDRRAVSFQGHPEFALDFSKMLVERCRRNGTIDITQADLARASMHRPVDSTRVIGWIRRFLEGGVD